MQCVRACDQQPYLFIEKKKKDKVFALIYSSSMAVCLLFCSSIAVDAEIQPCPLIRTLLRQKNRKNVTAFNTISNLHGIFYSYLWNIFYEYQSTLYTGSGDLYYFIIICSITNNCCNHAVATQLMIIGKTKCIQLYECHFHLPSPMATI